MSSFSGFLYRPFSAAVAIAAVSSMPGHISSSLKLPESSVTPSPVSLPELDSPAHRASVSDIASLPFLSLNKKPLSFVPGSVFGSFSFCVAPPTSQLAPYQYAKLASPQKNVELPPIIASSQSDALYRWHLPNPKAYGVMGSDQCLKAKSQTVVILLGWLGAKQKHLNRYADWYTSRGYHVVTFTFPLGDVMSYKVGGRVEQDVELLAEHLVDWVSEEDGKNLVFHTFSNTGWLTYVLSWPS
ncbi:hypothetical protein Cni_G22134 [Canna indica]|uniref:Transmembrane protein 53 n=1 Tax=Canna indica TaxID=4628 RepID=A0AAQ3QJB1_9LILI|nr:hypothetical protein Cni_G22134 [Canna indica]